MKDEELNARFNNLTTQAKEAHRLLRCGCLSTCSYELERIRRLAAELQSTVDDLVIAQCKV
jgi:hypothetical protein